MKKREVVHGLEHEKKREERIKRHSPSLKNLKRREKKLIQKGVFHPSTIYTHMHILIKLYDLLLPRIRFSIDNTSGIGMPHVFPTYNPTYQLIRSRWRKKVNQCLGEESYTLSDPRVSFEEL
jgi:hypothetical protein